MIRWLLALLLLIGSPALADEFKPAYLQLTERGSGSYDVLWKVPALDETTTLKVKPVFPPQTRDTTARRSSFANGAAVVRWRIAVPGGLNGQTIAFPDQAITRIDILVRVARADGTEQLGRVLQGSPGFTVTASPGRWEVVQTYTLLGIEHILAGIDHLLFVLALVMLVKGTRRLLWTVTAFTLAHSITLALATLGVIHVPGPPVEATIALSIVFVANEIVAQARGREGLAAKKPWLVAFSFGLLHGLGFAGALAEVGLPQNAIPLALLFFNIGVEIGQLLFIAGVLMLARLAQRLAAGHIHIAMAPVVLAYAIGGIASYWVIERVAAFWG
ncbi:MAG: HupE/UreJ family protein [Polymorphobacter sp.]